MAKLTRVYYSHETSCIKIGRRQLPLIAGDNLMMVMDLNSKGLAIDHGLIRGKELEEFTRKYNILSYEELKTSLEVSNDDFAGVLSQTVPCVGCRRSVERLYNQLRTAGHPTLDPIIINKNGNLTVSESKIQSPHAICALLCKHSNFIDSVLDNQTKNRKSTRCVLHSLDSFRSRPFSETWQEVWNSMKQRCKEKLALIEAKELHETLDNYLKKHKFCQECRTKVEKAYSLLTDLNPSKEKGYVAALYSNIRKCIDDKHIHLETKVEFIDMLIKRAEPEINGSYSKQRERHAKTLEIAQEEVLTCIGMCIYERLRRLHLSLREEERACQVLAAVAVHALCRSFDTSVEQKQGISNLELLYKEISREEKAKEHKREQKKLKKKKKKDEKKNKENKCNACDSNSKLTGSLQNLHQYRDDEIASINCHSCENTNDNTCGKSIDGGYSSEPSSHINSRTSSIASSPEGSEVACSDGLCNHEPPNSHVNYPSDQYNFSSIEISDCCVQYIDRTAATLSLQQMLEDFDGDEEKEDKFYIPNEVVLQYKVRENNIRELREKLRENLREKFNRMCIQTRMARSNCND